MEKKSMIRTLKTIATTVAATLLTVIGCPLLSAQAPHKEIRPKPPRPICCEKTQPEPWHPKPRDDSRKDLNSRREYEKYEKPEPESGAGLVFHAVFRVIVIGYGLVAVLAGLHKWLFENSAPQR